MKYAWTDEGVTYHIFNGTGGIKRSRITGKLACGTDVWSSFSIESGLIPPEERRMCKRCEALLKRTNVPEFQYDTTNNSIINSEKRIESIKNSIEYHDTCIINLKNELETITEKKAILEAELLQYQREAVMVSPNDGVVVDGTPYIVWDLGCKVMCLVNKNTLEQFKKEKFLKTPFNAVFFFTADELKDIQCISKQCK